MWRDYIALFGAGVASFLAPCLVPLLPAYFGIIVGESAEAHDTPARVVNREHDAAAKPIVGFSIRPIFISRLDQSTLQNLRAPVSAIDRPG